MLTVQKVHRWIMSHEQLKGLWVSPMRLICDVHWGYKDELDTTYNLKDFDWKVNLERLIIVRCGGP